jgi:hypothetical protein
MSTLSEKLAGSSENVENSDESTFEKKESPKYKDLLVADPPIAGQEFCCVSFVSPETEIKRREMFMFEKFVDQWELTRSMARFHDFLGFLSCKYSLATEKVFTDFQEFLKQEEENVYETLSVAQEFEQFLDVHEQTLGKAYEEQTQFRTSVRGIKIRGNFATEQEADEYAMYLRDLEPTVNVLKGVVGKWMPFDPKRGVSEQYKEERLNQLFQERDKNAQKAAKFMEERKRVTIERALKENKIRAEQSGNKLTQYMDENGKLCSVLDHMAVEEREAAK